MKKYLEWQTNGGRRMRKEELIRRNELAADGGSYLNAVPGRRQAAGLGVDAEDHDVVGILVGGQKILPHGIDGKIARRHASSGLVANRAESAVRIERENSDAVVTSVRTINKSPIRGNMNVGT